MFDSGSENFLRAEEGTELLSKNKLLFGIPYLDDATGGILPHDLILIGAGSGVGKTEIACRIALENLDRGKRVHYIALEAERREIERRIKFQMLAEKYFKDPNRPRETLTYRKYALGEFSDTLKSYIKTSLAGAERRLSRFKTLYKVGDYGLSQFVESVLYASGDTDLIILDHIHYFDLDERENENSAIKTIIKTARRMALEEGIPIVMIAHMRKPSRNDTRDLAPSMEEFHGSSDLYKIATKVITFAGGSFMPGIGYETFFRVCKNRIDGTATRFLGRHHYDTRKNAYDSDYKIGWSNLTAAEGFEELGESFQPAWTRYKTTLGTHHPPPEQKSLGWGAW